MRLPSIHIRKVFRFILSNSLGTGVDTLVLWLCSHYLFRSYGYTGQYLVSPLISFECAVLTNYLCSWYFIWGDRARRYPRTAFARKYLLYNLSATGAFLLKMAFLLLFERLFGWNVVVCNLAALCISGVVNFAMGEWVIFKGGKKEEGRVKREN